MTVQQIDVTKSRQRVSEFMRKLGRIQQPIDILLQGQVVGRLVPPGEFSAAEKAETLRKAWAFVERARAHNEGVPEREIAKVVDAATRRVRSRK